MEKYASGIYRLKNVDPKAQARLLLARVKGAGPDEEQVFVALAAYKKEGTALPQSILETAKQRKAAYEKTTDV